MSNDAADGAALRRTVGLPGAVLLGLGSIVGTGAYVSLAVACGAAGPLLPLAVLLAGGLAACNGLSSARLAAAQPVSGGTYAYARRLVAPAAGVAAGWLFLAAKSASAATAALGIGAYLAVEVGLDPRTIGLGAAVLATLCAAGGLRRSNVVNAAIVACTLGGLVVFAHAAFAHAPSAAAGPDVDAAARPGAAALAEAVALAFVAYTGYGRVATMGEEIRDPARSIPRAILLVVAASVAVHLLVALAALAAVGPATFAATVDEGGVAAPLARTLERVGGARWTIRAVEIGAVVAMAGVLLNLVLGLSRVAYAMGRDGELPRGLGRTAADGSPRAAVLAVGAVVAALVLIGDVRATWSFSAATVLGYYGLTNLAALRLPGRRRATAAVAGVGLAGCLGLAWFVHPAAWAAGLVVVGVPLAIRAVRRRTGGG